MDSSPPATSILDTLRTVEFRLGIKGYNVDEVDEYLDRAAQEAEALQENLRQLNERLRQAGDRIAQLEKDAREGGSDVAAPVAIAPTTSSLDLGPSDETLQRTLLLAQKFVDQVKRESEAEAAATVAEAETKAREALSAAEDAAKNLRSDSERQVREDVARLEAARTELATDVESMARHLESERNRLRDALTEILTWVEENVQPASSLRGIPPTPRLAPGPGPAAAPKASPATPELGGADAPNTGAADVDEQPTLNLHAVADSTQTGAPRPL
jgi:cell division initiation protein